MSFTVSAEVIAILAGCETLGFADCSGPILVQLVLSQREPIPSADEKRAVPGTPSIVDRLPSIHFRYHLSFFTSVFDHDMSPSSSPR